MRVLTLLEKTKSRGEDFDIHLAPPPGKTGQFITTAQAAKMLDVSMSRIRQYIIDGRLTSVKPEKGRRDNLLRLSQVKALDANPPERTGRPPEGEKPNKSSKDKDKKKDKKSDKK